MVSVTVFVSSSTAQLTLASLATGMAPSLTLSKSSGLQAARLRAASAAMYILAFISLPRF